jgi:hypothetical protein
MANPASVPQTVLLCEGRQLHVGILKRSQSMQTACLLAIVLALTSSGAQACMSTQSKQEIIEGHLLLRSFKDGAGRPEQAYMVRPGTPECLDVPDEPQNSVKGVRAIQIFSSNSGTARRIRQFVGKDVQVRGTVFRARTVHHHAPILMDVIDIDEI